MKFKMDYIAWTSFSLTCAMGLGAQAEALRRTLSEPHSLEQILLRGSMIALAGAFAVYGTIKAGKYYINSSS